MTVSLDMYMTAGTGILALFLGVFFTRAIPLLKRFCIPAPVSGGLAVSLLTLALHGLFGMDFQFDGTIKDIAMMLFFTSVGFQSDLRVLKEGGRPLLVMILLVAVLIALQNGLNYERLSYQTKGQQTDCSFELNSGLCSAVVSALFWVFFPFP